MVAPRASNMWLAVLIVGVAAAAHQWWSANIFTLSSDLFPRFAVGSVVGIGGFFGAVGGVLFQRGDGVDAPAERKQLHAGVSRVRPRLRHGAAMIQLLSPRLERRT